MEKILFFDVDGTLYDTNKTLPKSAKSAIFEAKQNGHTVAISTGRAPFMIESVLKELEIDSYVCFNGQYVVLKNEVIHTDAIKTEYLEEVTRFAGELTHPLVYLDENKMVSSIEEHPDVESGIFSLKFPYPEVDELYYENHPVYQTLIFCTEEEQSKYEEAFPHLKFVRWHPVSCDVLPGGGSKAKGMQIMLDRLGLTMKDAVAFGDGLNDVEMLDAAGISVAMGNALPEVKKHADHIAEHVNADGLAKVMKQLELI